MICGYRRRALASDTSSMRRSRRATRQRWPGRTHRLCRASRAHLSSCRTCGRIARRDHASGRARARPCGVDRARSVSRADHPRLAAGARADVAWSPGVDRASRERRGDELSAVQPPNAPAPTMTTRRPGFRSHEGHLSSCPTHLHHESPVVSPAYRIPARQSAARCRGRAPVDERNRDGWSDERGAVHRLIRCRRPSGDGVDIAIARREPLSSRSGRTRPLVRTRSS